jgi:phage replication O-like protein O
MSQATTTNAGNREPGFWRLPHDDLGALLARTDLTWETARVYLALADLTIGWCKKRDAVSLSQIAEHTGMDRAHVCRALRALAARKGPGRLHGSNR